MNNTSQPLIETARESSEREFRELVGRHIGLVYSTALRRVAGDAHLAQDVTQIVFKDLALKRAALPPISSVAGWLYRHTCFTAAKATRAEARRRAREREAAALEMSPAENETDWERIAPLLDDLMNRLNARERNAMILRFFAGRSLEEVADELRTSPEAARKLVSRGLTKLRALLLRRGVTSSAAALLAALASRAAAPVPDGLAASVSSLALAGAALPFLPKTAAILAFMTKLKISAVCALVAGTVSFSLWQKSEIGRLRALNDALRQQSETDRALATGNSGPVAAPESEAEAERKRRDFHELMQLRGEVAVLHARLAEQSGKKAAGSDGAKAGDSGAAGAAPSFRAAGTVRVPDGQTLVTGGWLTPSGNRGFMFAQSHIVATPGPRQEVIIEAALVDMTGDAADQAGFNQLLTQNGNAQQAALYTKDQWDAQMQTLTNLEGVQFLARPTVLTFGDGSKPAKISMGGDETNFVLTVTPQITAEGGAVDLTYDAQVNYPGSAAQPQP